MSKRTVDQAPPDDHRISVSAGRTNLDGGDAELDEAKEIHARALLAAIVDSSDDAIVSKSLEGTILSWNAAAERLFGYTAAEAMGRHISLIIPPELHDEEAAILQRLWRGEKIEHFETVRVARDGRRIDISLTISPVRDDTGRIIGASKIARDISRQAQDEMAVRESERRLRQVLEALPAAVYTTDAEGRIAQYNAAAVELSGRVPVAGQDTWCVSWRLYHPDGSPLPHDQCPMAVALREGRPRHGAEIVVERPDGSRISAAAYPTPLRDAAGRVTGAINMLVDVTKRKQAEDALREETRTAEILHRVGTRLAAELDLERTVQLVTDEATGVSEADFGAFFYNMVSRQGESYSLYTLSGISREAFSEFPMPRNTLIFEPTFRGERTVRLDDVIADPRYGQSPPHHGMPPGHPPVRSYLAVPVVSRSGEVLGGLFLGHARAGMFTERHERVVAGIAAQAAIAMDNARLYTQVQESNQRFRQLAEHVTDVFWITDVRTSRVVYVSPAYAEMWGRSCDSLYEDPLSFLQSVHPDDRDLVHNAMARQMRGETTAEEYRLIHEDGSLRWVWDRGFPILDDDGKVIRIAGIAEDITERKVAADRLRESEERYRRLTELLPVAVYTCGAPDGAITYYNDRAADLWGREPALGDLRERFCGSVRLFLPDGELVPHEECPMALALREGRTFRNQEVVIERPDASRINVLVNIDPLRDAEGRIVGAINCCLDITPLKQAEQHLREADRRKDEFLATLSHELRNPLAPLRYVLDLMDRAGDDGPMLQQFRDVLERQVGQMVRLTDDLLDLSRVTHDKLELRKERAALETVVEHALEGIRPLIEEAGHELTLRLPQDPLWLHVDPVRIAQALGNLLSNACKYTPAGGRIELAVTAREGEVLLSVKDDGQGIPPGQLESIFEMFAQSEQSARKQGGLGIGLTLVKRLVEMHAGSVRAFSDGTGSGSTFVITLPSSSAPDSSGPLSKAPEVAGPVPSAVSLRILVVDDNHDAADSLAALLSMAGYESHTAHDGPEALEAAERLRPHVVLLDLGLPKMDGIEVCRAIRQQAWGAEVTLVAITGWGQEQDRRRSRDAGFDHHLVKPVEYAAVEALLESLPN